MGISVVHCKGNLAHQMRYSVELLEASLHSNGTPHVLQLILEGEDERNPSFWSLYADGERVAHGTGEFAQECFFKNAHEFLDICRDAVSFISLPCWNEHDYLLLLHGTQDSSPLTMDLQPNMTFRNHVRQANA